MRIFKTKLFGKWAKKRKLADESLTKAIGELEQGLFDVKLGRFIYKKRIAYKKLGKRGAFRTIIAFQVNNIVSDANNKIFPNTKETELLPQLSNNTSFFIDTLHKMGFINLLNG